MLIFGCFWALPVWSRAEKVTLLSGGFSLLSSIYLSSKKSSYRSIVSKRSQMVVIKGWLL